MSKKVIVVGAGAWGKNLVRNFHELGALEAVVDPSQEIREFNEKEYGIATYADYDEALKHPGIDGVAIATPVSFHYDMALAALQAGKDVYIEKPMTHTVEEGKELVQVAEESGRILMIGHLLLYQPATNWIKEYIASGALGELYGIHLERLTLGRVRSFESVLWDLGVHDIAVILNLAGGQKPIRIRAAGHRILRDNLDDDVYIHFDFPGGVRADLHTSWLWPEMQRRMIVRGSKAMLVYDEVAQTVTLHRKRIAEDLSNDDQGSEVIYEGHGQPLKLELEHFLQRMEDRKPPLSDGVSGVAVMRVLEQVSEILNSH
ncbi:MAG: Gfo/Idh/MocA family oxidoreductase [Salinisphaeraceae bacterium]|nr:Gfo/Idh/MocA family oxidoreductase [Salinisphaeraceae bacterium]